MARLNLERLHEITEKYDEKFLYALLSEEGVSIDTQPYDEGLVELLLEFPDEMDKLSRQFLSVNLHRLGWDIYDGN